MKRLSALCVCLLSCSPCFSSSLDLSQKDKQLHLVASSVIASGITYSLGKTDHPVLYGVGATMAIGLAKEMYDYKNPQKHKSDINDLKADLVGAIAGAWVGHGVYLCVTKNKVSFSFNKNF